MVSNAMRVCVCVLLVSMGLSAQSHRGAIRGRVQDASGAVVANAAISAVNEATGETRTTTSGDAGAFALAELAPGAWRVEIGAPGHKTHVQRVVLAVNQERRADARAVTPLWRPDPSPFPPQEIPQYGGVARKTR